MGINNLKLLKNNSNIIESTVFSNLMALDNSLDLLIDESIKNLGVENSKQNPSKDFLVNFVYLDILKAHTFGKDNVYSNYTIILNHIEKVENILFNFDISKADELLEFRLWLGISDKFHQALTSL